MMTVLKTNFTNSVFFMFSASAKVQFNFHVLFFPKNPLKIAKTIKEDNRGALKHCYQANHSGLLC